MKFNLKSVFIILVVLFLTIVSVLPIFAAEPPFSDEAYWNKLCSGIGYQAKDKKDCNDYKTYLNDKVGKEKGELTNLKSDLASAKVNLSKYDSEVKTYESQIEALELDVKAIESDIKWTETKIATLQLKIIEREVTIEEKEAQVKNYIAVSQSQSRVNGYVEFIMGAKNFSDILMRFEGLNRIKTFNEKIINELVAERIALEEDKEEAESSKVALVTAKELLDIQAARVETLMSKALALFEESEKLAAKLEADAAKMNEKVALTEKQKDSIKQFFPPPLPDLPTTPPNSSSWTHPLSGSNYAVGSWGFRYRGSYKKGQHHTGADYTTRGNRSTLVMPGDGIVVIANDNNCPNGSTNSTCGNGWGNYVSMLVLIEGAVYGVSMAHLTAGSLISKSMIGQPIKAGTALGKVGTSGLSTGIHLHIEVYRTNYTDIDAAFNAWSGDRYFGAVSRYCHSNGNSAPCKVDAPILFGDMSVSAGYYN